MASVEVREMRRVADDEGFPAAYLIFVVAATMVIAVIAVSAFLILIR
jgi:hypothetical protein